MKKIIWPGIIAGFAMLVVSVAVSYVFMSSPLVMADYTNAALVRSWADPLMTLFFLYPFIQCLLLAWFWNKYKSAFTCTSANGRGVEFGIAAFLIAGIPGMFVTYTTFPIAFITVLSWTVSSLLGFIVTGIILARMNR